MYQTARGLKAIPRLICFARAHACMCAVLSNDLKALTNEAERLIHQLHAVTRETGTRPSTPPVASPDTHIRRQEAAGLVLGAEAMDISTPSLQPFAVVDELAPNSPASEAGIQLGDRLLQFGGITAQTPNTLQQVAAELQACEGRAVDAAFLRLGVGEVRLQLVPRRWSGRGLLGCHLQPL
jgi:26S proteasome non-ATPase regulatory subunit 9